MTQEQLIQDLKESLITELHLDGTSPADIGDNEALFGEEGLQLDSLDAVELVVLIEKRYGVVLEDVEEARKAFSSITVLAEYIQQHPTAKLP